MEALSLLQFRCKVTKLKVQVILQQFICDLCRFGHNGILAQCIAFQRIEQIYKDDKILYHLINFQIKCGFSVSNKH